MSPTGQVTPTEFVQLARHHWQCKGVWRTHRELMELAVKASYPEKWCFMPNASQIIRLVKRTLEYMKDKGKTCGGYSVGHRTIWVVVTITLGGRQ